MPHITLTNNFPGIVGLMVQRPDAAQHLNGLAQVLLQSSGDLSRGEREYIAAFVSHGNQCTYCCNVHFNVSLAHFHENPTLIDVTKDELGEGIELRPVMQALLRIAEKVRIDGRSVSTEDIENAKSLGATDNMIHDTVLIAAAFCMFNRYVDGLGTFAPKAPQFYGNLGKQLASGGYLNALG